MFERILGLLDVIVSAFFAAAGVSLASHHHGELAAIQFVFSLGLLIDYAKRNTNG